MLSPATLTGSGGGLRGGSWGIDGRRLILRDYQAVTGVTVTGAVRDARAPFRGSRARRPRKGTLDC